MLSLEPDFSYLEALAPYQPLAMKCIYCPIDTRLNFIQVSKLLKEVQVRRETLVSSVVLSPLCVCVSVVWGGYLASFLVLTSQASAEYWDVCWLPFSLQSSERSFHSKEIKSGRKRKHKQSIIFDEDHLCPIKSKLPHHHPQKKSF